MAARRKGIPAIKYNELTEEQKAKAKACSTPEELVALAQQEGVELTDEQLEAVAGGGWASGGFGKPGH